MRSKSVIVGVVCILVLSLGALFAGGCGPGEEVVTVGSKEFTEQLVLGQITILALEHNGIPTRDETGLVGTVIVREAQLRGMLTSTGSTPARL